MSENVKESRKSMYIVGLICLVVFLCIHKCKPEKEYIIIPEKKGSFSDTIIKHDTIDLSKTIYMPKYIVKYEKSINNWQREIDSLKAHILGLVSNGELDSIKSILDNELALRGFHGAKEDENIEVHYSGIVKGELKAIDIDYKIKEQKIEIPSKLEFFAGPRLQVNTSPYKNKHTDNLGQVITEPYKFQDAYNLGVDLYARHGSMIYNANINTDKQISIGVAKKFY